VPVSEPIPPPSKKGQNAPATNPPDSRDAYHAIIKKFLIVTQSRDSQAPINHRRPALNPGTGATRQREQ
jgi:hypothetical protein